MSPAVRSSQAVGSPQSVAVWLCLLAALAYLLTYSGVLHAVDEQSALSVAESMLLGQGFHTNQMEWDQARTPPQNAVGVDGNLYSKKGLGVSLLALPLFGLGRQLPFAAGAAQLALLSGSLVTLLAVWAFFWLARSLGYSLTVGTSGALLLAVGSPLWPYARTLFSETPGAAGLALALWGMVAWRRTRLSSWLLLAGSGLALLILVKSSNGVVAPFFGLYWLWSTWEQRRDASGVKTLVRELAAFGAPVLLAAGATVAYNYVRFGTTLGFPLEPFETFSTPLALGLAGLLISPGKGIFWYFPALWLAPFFIGRWRINGRLPDYLLAAAAALALIGVYALWYDWPGGRAWGPRMIITATPALAMLVLPAIDWLVTGQGGRWARLLAGSLLVLSFIVQMPGVLVNFERQEELDMQAGRTFAQLLWSPELSPLLTYWQRIGATPDPLWLQPYLRAWPPSPLLWALAGSIGLAAVALALAAWRIGRGRQGRGWLAVASVALGLLMVVLPLLAYEDPRWDEQSAVREDNRAIMRSIQEVWQPGDLVLLDLLESSDKGRRTGQWLNFAASEPSIGWLRKPMDEAAAERLAAWLTPYRRVWLVLQATDEGDSASVTEVWLEQGAFGGRRWWTGDQRVVEFLLPPPPHSSAQVVEGPFIFGDSVVLQGYQLAVDDVTGAVWLHLLWDSPGSEDTRFSLQALDGDGRLLAQVDGTPSAGEDEETRAGLRLPQPDAHLILKLYRAGDGSVLPLASSSSESGVDYLSLTDR